MVFSTRRYLLLWLLAVASGLFVAQANAVDNLAFRSIEAVRSDWNAMQPPADGWEPVTLEDNWHDRWPDYDGVAWYRLKFDFADGQRQSALFIDYWSLAGAVWLNGSLLDRDASLVEPLSRSWNTSRLINVSPPVLRYGENELLFRISSLAPYSPGLGSVVLGDAEALAKRYAQANIIRHDVPILNLAMTLTLGVFFGVVWFVRREQSAYGWYAVMSLAWAAYLYNLVAHSPWPFADTDSWARLNMMLFMLNCSAFLMFSIRFAERRYVRFERLLWACTLGACLVMLFVGHGQIFATRIVFAIFGCLIYMGACCFFVAMTWRVRRLDLDVLNIVNLIVLVGAVHDLLVFAGVLPGTLYTFPITTQMRVACMAFVLAWHFVQSLRRIEGFKDELVQNVVSARAQLTETLRQQHEMVLAGIRQNERLSLLHNLHDGLGGTLVNNISLIEQAPQRYGADRFLSVLKELREELRIIVDTSSDDNIDARSLADWLAPIRSRYSLLCESRDISCEWELDGVEECQLTSRRSLDVVRIVQESITNALKHASPSEIGVTVAVTGQAISLAIRDNGTGFDLLRIKPGTGIASLRSRAERLGGTFSITSEAHGTAVEVLIPNLDKARGA